MWIQLMTLLNSINWQTDSTIIANIFVIIAALAAIAGLSTWRKELKGKTEYELASRILKTTYQLRDALNDVREWYIDFGEINIAMKKHNFKFNMRSRRFEVESKSAVFEERWIKVVNVLQDLEVEAVEAEVLWGKDIKKFLLNLKTISIILVRKIQLYLTHLKNPKLYPLDEEQLKSLEKYIYGPTYLKEYNDQVEEDDFALKLEFEIYLIEQIINPYLISKNKNKIQKNYL